MSIWWNGGNQLISSLAVMKCVVQAAAPSQCRQCPGVLYLFPVHARSVRPSPLTPPSPGPSAHKRTARPCPDSVSPHQWPWHKAQTFNKIKSTLKSVSVTFLISCNKINCIWIFILYIFSFSDRKWLVTFDDVNWLRRFEMSGTETTTMWWTETLW